MKPDPYPLTSAGIDYNDGVQPTIAEILASFEPRKVPPPFIPEPRERLPGSCVEGRCDYVDPMRKAIAEKRKAPEQEPDPYANLPGIPLLDGSKVVIIIDKGAK